MEVIMETDASVMVSCVLLCQSCLLYLLEAIISASNTLTFGFGHILTGAIHVMTRILDFSFRVPVQRVIWKLYPDQTNLETTLDVVLNTILHGVSDVLITLMNIALYMINEIIICSFKLLQLIVIGLFPLLTYYIRFVDYVVFGFVFPVVDVIFWLCEIPFALICVVFVVTVIRDLVYTMDADKYIILSVITVLCYFVARWWEIALPIILCYAVHPIVYLFVLFAVPPFMLSLKQLFRSYNADIVNLLQFVINNGKNIWLGFKHVFLNGIRQQFDRNNDRNRATYYLVSLVCFAVAYVLQHICSHVLQFAWSFVILCYGVHHIVYYIRIVCLIVCMLFVTKSFVLTLLFRPYYAEIVNELQFIPYGNNIWLGLKYAFMNGRRQQSGIQNYRNRSSNDESEDTPRDCLICVEERPFVTILPCMHKNICNTCVTRWRQGDNRCPLCRTDIEEVRT